MSKTIKLCRKEKKDVKIRPFRRYVFRKQPRDQTAKWLLRCEFFHSLTRQSNNREYGMWWYMKPFSFSRARSCQSTVTRTSAATGSLRTISHRQQTLCRGFYCFHLYSPWVIHYDDPISATFPAAQTKHAYCISSLAGWLLPLLKVIPWGKI